MLYLTDLSAHESLNRLSQYKLLAMVNFAKSVLPTEEEIARVFNTVNHGPISAQALMEGIEPSRQVIVMRSLVWLLKLGLLRLA